MEGIIIAILIIVFVYSILMVVSSAVGLHAYSKNDTYKDDNKKKFYLLIASTVLGSIGIIIILIGLIVNSLIKRK
jgi:CDP-diglyceride synthetase